LKFIDIYTLFMKRFFL